MPPDGAFVYLLEYRPLRGRVWAEIKRRDFPPRPRHFRLHPQRNASRRTCRSYPRRSPHRRSTPSPTRASCSGCSRSRRAASQPTSPRSGAAGRPAPSSRQPSARHSNGRTSPGSAPPAPSAATASPPGSRPARPRATATTRSRSRAQPYSHSPAASATTPATAPAAAAAGAAGSPTQAPGVRSSTVAVPAGRPTARHSAATSGDRMRDVSSPAHVRLITREYLRLWGIIPCLIGATSVARAAVSPCAHRDGVRQQVRRACLGKVPLSRDLREPPARYRLVASSPLKQAKSLAVDTVLPEAAALPVTPSLSGQTLRGSLLRVGVGRAGGV